MGVENGDIGVGEGSSLAMESQLSNNAIHEAGLVEQEVLSLTKECSPVRVRGIGV